MDFLTSFLPGQIDDVARFILLGSVAAMLFSMAKAGFGGGIGMLSTPIMILAVGTDNTKLALGIMLPILVVADYVILFSWYGKWEWRRIAGLMAAAVVGVGIGAGVLWWLIENVGSHENARMNAILALGIGIIALGFVGLQVVRRLRKLDQQAFSPQPWQTGVVGLAAGFTSTMAHAAGPIVAMYLLPQRMEKTKFVATTALYYWLGNQLKVVPYLLLGLINYESVRAGAALVPAIAVGAVVGVLLHKRIGQKQFTGVVYVLLALAGVHLINKSMQELLPAYGQLVENAWNAVTGG
jgi:uncharacterized membrane protein YfcA